jgi:hypothetical protein
VAVFLFVCVRLSGATIATRRQEDISLVAAGVVIVVCWVLVYCGLHALALKRFTHAWHRTLFLQMVGWTCTSIAFAAFVVSHVNWSHTTLIPLAPLWPIIGQRILSILVVSQLGALFGQWLARPNRLPIQQSNATSL